MATDLEVDTFSKGLQDTEKWLYEEGNDESKHLYIRKVEYLPRAVCIPQI